MSRVSSENTTPAAVSATPCPVSNDTLLYGAVRRWVDAMKEHQAVKGADDARVDAMTRAQTAMFDEIMSIPANSLSSLALKVWALGREHFGANYGESPDTEEMDMIDAGMKALMADAIACLPRGFAEARP